MKEKQFELVCNYAPAGDQPQAIEKLVSGLDQGMEAQTLLGVTGSGKTFTMANIIHTAQRPALLIAHNKTLAAQLYDELKSYFPNNAVEYFISYYDYYQPEAYIARTDTYIEKEAQINDEIDRLRHSTTRSLFERRDVVVIASVSCIYGLGMPKNYFDAAIRIHQGDTLDRDQLLRHLVKSQYSRNDLNLKRSCFRARGDVVEVQPAYEDRLIRIEFFGDEVERISILDPLTGEIIEFSEEVVIYPAIHYVANADDLARAVQQIERELEVRLGELRHADKLIEAQRLEQRTLRDIEMIREVGYCNGIENYSRIFENRSPGTPPLTLLDYFPKDFLLFVDESHVTLPQLRGMYHGDRSRKNNLVEYGFRLPCARDNRPLNIDEFWSRVGQRVYVSATPAKFELGESAQVAEQIIRPTGLLDPEVEVRKTLHQVDNLMGEIRTRAQQNERVLITTLTKRMAEDLTEYLKGLNIRVQYVHSDIKPLERVSILRDLRLGLFDVLIGVNLLREGLDLPEVTLVAIMDADKEGFLRSESSLIQTIGRAARNASGKVILYADKMTDSMNKAISETNRRRKRQMDFNEAHGIIPKTIEKKISHNLLDMVGVIQAEEELAEQALRAEIQTIGMDRLPDLIQELEIQMREAAKFLEFEKAAQLRDQMQAMKAMLTAP
jgi:excinuclease ABC subunit B